MTKFKKKIFRSNWVGKWAAQLGLALTHAKIQPGYQIALHLIWLPEASFDHRPLCSNNPEVGFGLAAWWQKAASCTTRNKAIGFFTYRWDAHALEVIPLVASIAADHVRLIWAFADAVNRDFFLCFWLTGWCLLIWRVRKLSSGCCVGLALTCSFWMLSRSRVLIFGFGSRLLWRSIVCVLHF